MKKGRLKYLAFALTMLFIIQACDITYLDKDIEDFEWNGGLVLPIGSISYTFGELFDEVDLGTLDIVTSNDGIISFVYEKSLAAAQKASDFITIPNQALPQTIIIGTEVGIADAPIAAPIAVDIPITPTTIKNKLSMGNGEEVKTIIFKEGNLILDVASTFPDIALELAITFSFLKKKIDNSPYQETITITALTPGKINIPLKDYKGDFTAVNGSTNTNNIEITVSGKIKIAVGDKVASTDTFTFDMTMQDIKYETIYADLKTKNLDIGSQTIDFEVFDEFGTGDLTGDLTFADPSFEFIVTNSFGFPLGVNFGNIEASNDTESLKLTGSVTTTTQLVNAPSISQVGDSITTTLSINKANSNIVDLLALEPNKFTIDISADSNPAGGFADNFISETSQLSAALKVNMPLDVVFANIMVEEEIDDFDGDDFKDVKEFTLNVISTNTIPLGGKAKIVFYNNDTLVYTIDEQAIFDPAPVDANGKSTGAAKNTSSFVIKGADVKEATRITVNLTMNTTNASSNTAVKLLSTDAIEIKLTAEASINYNN